MKNSMYIVYEKNLETYANTLSNLILKQKVVESIYVVSTKQYAEINSDTDTDYTIFIGDGKIARTNIINEASHNPNSDYEVEQKYGLTYAYNNRKAAIWVDSAFRGYEDFLDEITFTDGEVPIDKRGRITKIENNFSNRVNDFIDNTEMTDKHKQTAKKVVVLAPLLAYKFLLKPIGIFTSAALITDEAISATKINEQLYFYAMTDFCKNYLPHIIDKGEYL